MKASIKFREDQNPKFRAKVPLSILGYPFQSGIEAGDSKELCLNFCTFFESSPLFKLSYRPNDSYNPFSLGLKIGIGQFGSPINAHMTMSTEFNLLRNGSPRFFVHFRPQIGDYSIRRSVQSHIVKPSQSPIQVPKFKALANDIGEANGETVHKGEVQDKSILFRDRINGLPVWRVVDRVVSFAEVSARTALPVRDCAMVKFRWTLRFPAEMKSSFAGDGDDRTAEIVSGKMPYLVLSKIGIEHVAVRQGVQRSEDVAEACLTVKKEIDVLQAESGLLRKGIDELRSEIGSGKLSPVTGGENSGEKGEVESNGGELLAGKKMNKEKRFSPEYEGFTGKVTDGNVTATMAGI